MNAATERTTLEKVDLFLSRFSGRTDVYGTYDPASGKVRQAKEPVTKNVIRAHLKGERPYGVYLLVNDTISALAVDFDEEDPLVALEFVTAAKRYGIPGCVERSKSKGYHVWMFFATGGVLAAKARIVARHILEDIEEPKTEVFPKQDRVDDGKSYGNFINAPLFGALVPQGRTVFIDENLRPYPNQWDFLENVEVVPANRLDEIIESNNLGQPRTGELETASPSTAASRNGVSYGLPVCAQRMLNEGVRSYQRVACFRLAVQLRKAGLPCDLAVTVLKAWAPRNRPNDGKRIITEREIVDQTAWAYTKPYQGCGCEETAVAWYCDSSCPLHKTTSTS